MIIHKPLEDPANLNLSTLKTLGSGLWGVVYDLGDGTVLKRSKQICAGVGEGLEKIKREQLVLSALEEHCSKQQLAVPRPLGWGAHSDGEYPNWLQTTRVAGSVRKVAEIAKLPTERQAVVGRAVAVALVQLQQMLATADLEGRVPTAQENLQSLAKGLTDDSVSLNYLGRLQQMLAKLGNAEQQVIHGDFNISNLLFSGDTVNAVIDFAETRQGFYEEDLIAIVSELPALRESLFNTFEELTGYAINAERLQYALALKSLLTYAICKRLGEKAASEEAELRLKEQLSD